MEATVSRPFPAVRSLLPLLAAALTLAGCSHPYEDVPTPAGAVARLEQIAASIEDAFEAGTPEESHDSMHDVAWLLVAMQKPAFLEQLDEGARAEVSGAVDSIFAAYEKVDSAMFHGNEGSDPPSYDTIRDDIAQALATLRKHIPDTGAEAAELPEDAEHDHEGHDHDHGDLEHEGHDHEAEQGGDAT